MLVTPFLHSLLARSTLQQTPQKTTRNTSKFTEMYWKSNLNSDTKHSFKQKPREMQAVSINFNKLIQAGVCFLNRCLCQLSTYSATLLNRLRKERSRRGSCWSGFQKRTKNSSTLSSKQKLHILKTEKKKNRHWKIFFNINFGSLPNTRRCHKKNICCCRCCPFVLRNMKVPHRISQKQTSRNAENLLNWVGISANHELPSCIYWAQAWRKSSREQCCVFPGFFLLKS